MPKKWESYEEVARYLIEECRVHFNLAKVEEKQELVGTSGATWEIDGKGLRTGDGAVIVMECRRHTTSAISQEQVGGLAYRIRDLGGAGGIMVSPLGLQSGAKIVAAAENVIEVKLSPDATTVEYLMEFLDRIHVGLEDRLGPITDAVGIVLRDARTGAIVEVRGDAPDVIDAAKRAIGGDPPR